MQQSKLEVHGTSASELQCEEIPAANSFRSGAGCGIV
jgi:hypothetical protein